VTAGPGAPSRCTRCGATGDTRFCVHIAAQHLEVSKAGRTLEEEDLTSGWVS
jgi:hypothetical protein